MRDHRAIELAEPVEAELRSLARSAWPDEGCAVLFSPRSRFDRDPRPISRASAVPNEARADRSRSFVITAATVRSAETRAARQDELVSGFFHSHPDRPACPSQVDIEHAWPGYCYLIASVDRWGVVSEFGAYLQDPASGELAPARLVTRPGERDGR